VTVTPGIASLNPGLMSTQPFRAAGENSLVVGAALSGRRFPRRRREGE